MIDNDRVRRIEQNRRDLPPRIHFSGRSVFSAVRREGISCSLLGECESVPGRLSATLSGEIIRGGIGSLVQGTGCSGRCGSFFATGGFSGLREVVPQEGGEHPLPLPFGSIFSLPGPVGGLQNCVLLGCESEHH